MEKYCRVVQKSDALELLIKEALERLEQPEYELEITSELRTKFERITRRLAEKILQFAASPYDARKETNVTLKTRDIADAINVLKVLEIIRK